MAAAAARSFLRSSPILRAAAPRLPAGAPLPPRAAQFRLPNLHAAAPRVLRSPVELSAYAESMMPMHTAIASALMTSMLSVSRSYGWLSEGHDDR